MQQRWRARWIAPDGAPYEYIFSSTTSRVVARVDFMLKVMDLGCQLPVVYELEEANERQSFALHPDMERNS